MDRYAQMMRMQAEEQTLIDRLEADPWDIEVRLHSSAFVPLRWIEADRRQSALSFSTSFRMQSQKKIEEIIRQKAVSQSYEDAVEYNVRSPSRPGSARRGTDIKMVRCVGSLRALQASQCSTVRPHCLGFLARLQARADLIALGACS